MTPEIWIATVIKLLGAGCGAALALVFSPPRTMSGFIRRLSAAMIFGFIFSPYILEWAGFEHNWEGLIAAATLAGFISWAAMGTITRVVGAWQAGKTAADGDN